MKWRILLFVIGLTLSVSAAADVGQQIFNINVGQLPATCTPSRPYWVVDGDDGTDCSTGGGSVVVQCVCNATGDGYDGVAVGSGAISGSGTDTYIAMWNAADTLTDSSSFEDGSGLNIEQLALLLETATPATCNTATEGAIYYDSLLNEPCFCNGTSWSPVDGSGSCGALNNWVDSTTTDAWLDTSGNVWSNDG